METSSNGSARCTNGTRVNGAKVNRMSAALRWTLYGVSIGLWTSGCLWLVLHLYFQTATEFGSEPHAWEPPLLLVHGVLAVPALYLFGWISARHVLEGWRMARRRPSGGTIFLVLAVLVASGFGLYFLTGEAARSVVAFVHEALGVPAIAAALLHWRSGAAGQRQMTDFTAAATRSGVKPKCLNSVARRRRLAEGVDADDGAVEADVLAPVVGHAGFDRDARQPRRGHASR